MWRTGQTRLTFYAYRSIIVMNPKYIIFSIIFALQFTISEAQQEDDRGDTLVPVVKELRDQMEIFNKLYFGKLERELSSTANKVSGMESTLRAIADRAMAWDNIQNHMAVWTDQSRTMERKLDMLNRCHSKQEIWESKLGALDTLNNKLNALDKKINTMSRLEFKIEKVSERIDEINSKINLIQQRSGQVNIEQPSLTKLAQRGLVSYLSTVEEKLDGLMEHIERPTLHSTYRSKNQFHASRSQTPWYLLRADSRNGLNRMDDSKKNLACKLAKTDARLLEDVSAKVDIIFDRSLNPDYDHDSLVGHLKRETPSRTEYDFEKSPEHLFAKFWKSLFNPFKKMNRRYKAFEKQLLKVEGTCNSSTTSRHILKKVKLFDGKLQNLDDTMREEMEQTRITVGRQTSRLDQITQVLSNSVYTNEKYREEINRQFAAQNKIIKRTTQDTRNVIFKKCSGIRSASSSPYTPLIDTAKKAIFANITYRNNYPQVHSKRPASTRASSVRPSRCFPKNSPFWKLPNISPNVAVCYDKTSRSYSSKVYFRNRNASISNRSIPTNNRKYERNSYVKGKRRIKRSLDTKKGKFFSTKHFSQRKFFDCSDISSHGISHIGSLKEINEAGRDYYTRFCDQVTDGGGWTILQRRTFSEKGENFIRPWKDYKDGFGNLTGEFWFGNEYIHRLTSGTDMIARFDLWDFDGNYAFAEYSSFRISSLEEHYKLSVSGYRGNASDSFSMHNGHSFSTYDINNNTATSCCPCSPAYSGGWWFYSCCASNLNGIYHRHPTKDTLYKGIIWRTWLGDYPLRASEIKVRPSNVLASNF